MITLGPPAAVKFVLALIDSGVGLSEWGVRAVKRVANLHTFENFPSLLVLLKFLHISILFTKVICNRGEFVNDFAVKVYRLIQRN